MSNRVDLHRFVQRLANVEKEVRANKTPQLGYSSMHDGALDVFDREGNYVGRIGKQYDGTYGNVTFGGDVPPPPNMAYVSPAAGGARVYWDGTLVDDLALPMNFERVTVHAVLDVDDYSPVESNQIVGEFASGLGGEIYASLELPQEYFIILTAWSTSGKFSAPSAPAFVTPLPVGGDGGTPEITAPTESPAIASLTGMPSSLVVATEAVRPEDRLEYHISTDENFIPVPGDPATLALPLTASTVVTIAAMPSGAGLLSKTPYYVRVIARNDEGSAPASEVVEAELDPSAVEAVIAAKLVAGFILAGQVTVGNITIHPDTGITIQQPGGVIRFPANAGQYAEISGHLTAQTLAVLGTMSIDGGAVLNSRMVLSAGITPPSTAPILSSFWPTLKFQDGYEYGDVFYGLSNVLSDTGSGALNPQWWVTAVAFYGGGVRLIDRNTGAQWGAISTPSWSSVNPIGGITQIGNNYYVLGQDPSRNNDWYILRLNHNFVKISELLYTSSGAFDGRPAIGRNDAGQPIIAFIAAGSKKLSITRRDPVTLHSVSTSVVDVVGHNPSGAGGTHNFAGVHEGITDQGSGNSRIYVATNGVKKVSAYVDNSGTLARYTSLDFGTAGVSPKGVVFDRSDPFKGVGRWVSLDNAGNIHRYSGFATTTTLWARSTFYDDNAGGTGRHETAPSDYSTQLAVQPRAWLRVQVASAPDANSTDPSKPDKADRSRVYVGAGGAEPTFQGTLAVGVKMLEIAEVASGSTAPAYPVDFTNAGSTAASIETPSGAYYLNGQGDARLRNLTVDTLTADTPVVHNPAITVRRNDAQGLTSGSTVTIAWDRCDFADSWGSYVTGTTIYATSLTIPQTGLYEIIGSIAPAVAGTAALWHSTLLINGTASRIFYRGAGSPTSPLVARGTLLQYLTAGQTIGLGIYTTATGTLATYPGSAYVTELSARWVGP